MKKTRKILATVLTIAIALSCSAVVAFATGAETETTRMMQVYGLTEQEFEVVYQDENIEIMTAFIPAGNTTRAAATGTGTASPYAYPSYRCQARYGNCCRFAVENIDDSASMYVTFECDDVDYVSDIYKVTPGGRQVTIIKNRGEGFPGLTCEVSAIIQAVGASSSVDYSYEASQYVDHTTD